MASNDKTFVAYFQSWSEKWSDDSKKLQLASIAPYVNMVIVSFLKPDTTYGGNNKLVKCCWNDAMEFTKAASGNTKRHQSKLSNDCTSDMSDVVTRQLPATTF